jgi:Protein of unknown function (DUF3822)
LPAENQTVNPSFNITTINTPTDKPILLVQAGKQGISFIQLDIGSNTFTSVKVYHFSKRLSDSGIAEEMNTILCTKDLMQQHFKKIFVTWCFDENILVPNEYFDSDNAGKMLELVYGDAMLTAVQTELVPAYNLHTIYKIPVVVKNVFNTWFPFSIQTHQSSLLINIENQNKDLVYCNFYYNYLTIVLRKNGQLQAIQNFEFNTPEDAIYHLLNICQSFETDATQTILTVSGMVDADSNLYNELHKYFLQINFADLPDNFKYTEEIKNYPVHYFSHLFATAICVL